MRKEDFENMVESVRQAGRIRRGEEQPSRVVEFAPVDVKAVIPFLISATPCSTSPCSALMLPA